MQGGVSAGAGGDKHGDWGESQGWKWNVPVPCVILLRARHDRHRQGGDPRSNRPNSSAIIEQVLSRPHCGVSGSPAPCCPPSLTLRSAHPGSPTRLSSPLGAEPYLGSPSCSVGLSALSSGVYRERFRAGQGIVVALSVLPRSPHTFGPRRVWTAPWEAAVLSVRAFLTPQKLKPVRALQIGRCAYSRVLVGESEVRACGPACVTWTPGPGLTPLTQRSASCPPDRPGSPQQGAHSWVGAGWSSSHQPSAGISRLPGEC